MLSVKSLIRRKHHRRPLRLSCRAEGCEEYFPGGRALDDLRFDGFLEHLENGFIRVNGSARLSVELPCARCLKACPLRLDTEVKASFVPQSRQALWLDSDWAAEEIDFETYLGEEIDLRALLLQRLLQAAPYKVLCAEDCRGICPRCGTDLNEARCACRAAEEEGAEKPFAELKKLL